MKNYKKLFFSIIFLLFLPNVLMADLPKYLDFKFVLNESEAGKKAQAQLKKKLDNGVKDLSKQEKTIQEEEKKIIQQKKILSPEDYKKKVTELRKKVSDLQKKRSKLLNTVANQRSKARSELLKNLNPVVKEYMVEKNIRMVLDKKGVILADEKLDITNDIITKLNARIKTLKFD
ncbi:OmpH family outer membrane protein [Pelagibacteraceae bacterium]|jgi:outer membrane protein|nr:OmpH family outer membrane protein [Pelagibacteraceae bacterium]